MLLVSILSSCNDFSTRILNLIYDHTTFTNVMWSLQILICKNYVWILHSETYPNKRINITFLKSVSSSSPLKKLFISCLILLTKKYSISSFRRWINHLVKRIPIWSWTHLDFFGALPTKRVLQSFFFFFSRQHRQTCWMQLAIIITLRYSLLHFIICK